jgi:tetratricopeptide (TPR) repeat protein
MVSQYDAFLGSLIRTFLSAIPDKLRSKERTMSFEEILQFDSIDELKSHLIEEQIDTVLRQSHRDQFAWLENRFNVPLKKLEIWADFIELTQRRNLYVHTDGRVTRQYLKICREEGVKQDSLPLYNSIIRTDFNYVEKSYRVLYEIGLKLSQVLLHKCLGSRNETADEFLNSEAYSHIAAGEFDTAIMLLDFALDIIPKKSTEFRRLTFVVNRANAYRLKGDRAKCADLISGQDWKVLALKFQIAEAALREDVIRVVQLMKEIGRDDKEMSARTYREWPLFNGIRESVNFQEAFAGMFGEALNEVRQLEGTEIDIAAVKALPIN